MIGGAVDEEVIKPPRTQHKLASDAPEACLELQIDDPGGSIERFDGPQDHVGEVQVV